MHWRNNEVYFFSTHKKIDQMRNCILIQKAESYLLPGSHILVIFNVLHHTKEKLVFYWQNLVVDETMCPGGFVALQQWRKLFVK